MSTIKNERMKGRTLTTSFGKFAFNSEGVAEVPDEHANKLLALKGYKIVGEAPKGDENDDEQGKVGENPTGGENSQNDDESNAGNEEKDDETEDEGSNPDAEGEGSDDTSNSEGVADGDNEEKVVETTFSPEELEGKNVPQLKKIAKDNGIDLQGATKSDEIKAIIIGAMASK